MTGLVTDTSDHFNVFLERVTSETKPALGKELGLSRKLLLLELLFPSKLSLIQWERITFAKKKFHSEKILALKPKECEFGDEFYTVNSGIYLTSEPQFLVCRVGMITTVCSNELKVTGGIPGSESMLLNSDNDMSILGERILCLWKGSPTSH